MRFDFANDMSLEEVRGVIARHNERTGTDAFIEADRGDHVIFNYVVSFDGAFPSPTTGDVALDREYAILRECRGLTFCKNSGRILARKFAKFFNVNEKPETQAGLIDWSQPHVILEKLDGSMITPFWTGDLMDIDADHLRWCTKMGLTDVAKPVEDYVAANPHYARYSAHVMANDCTPIYEWCTRKQKIVVDYPEDRLVLLAIRDNKTGAYRPYSELLKAEASGIEVVRALPGSVENIEQFMAEVRDLEGIEGYIIRFDDGHMLKVKGAWYVQLHKTKELLQYEKDVLQLIYEDRLDDAKAFMDDGDRERVEAFNDALIRAIDLTAARLTQIVAEGRAVTTDKKSFVEYVRRLTLADQEQGILFSIYDGKDGVECVRRILAKHCHTGPRVQSVRHLMGGLRWEDYRDKNSVAGDD